MKPSLIVFLMVLFQLFSRAQSLKYNSIGHDILFYEFNTERDTVYFLDYGSKLWKYSVDSDSTEGILPEYEFKASGASLKNNMNPMFYTDDGHLFIVDNYYIRDNHFVYELKDDELVSKIPLFDENQIHSLYENKDKLKYYDFVFWATKKFLAELDPLEILVLPDKDIHIARCKDGKSFAFYKRFLDNNPEITNGFASCIKHVPYTTDATVQIENKGRKRTVTSFESGGIMVKEKAYGCELFKIMSFITKCRYKMKIISPEIRITLKDKVRRNRVNYKSWGEVQWNCNFNESIPSSKFITDCNGDIYVLFYFGEDRNLVKIFK